MRAYTQTNIGAKAALRKEPKPSYHGWFGGYIVWYAEKHPGEELPLEDELKLLYQSYISGYETVQEAMTDGGLFGESSP